jgi:hypothetical protein
MHPEMVPCKQNNPADADLARESVKDRHSTPAKTTFPRQLVVYLHAHACTVARLFRSRQMCGNSNTSSTLVEVDMAADFSLHPAPIIW